MKNYQIIAKKFRPKQFSEVFEQDAIVQTLKNAIVKKRIGHAYLFSGTRGTGKTTLARLFAKVINCKTPTDNQEPCNQCHSCIEIDSGQSLDVIEIDGASNRGIDDIRNINETIGYAASNGHYKVYIIDEVHMLTKEAFNALLKTLEEPPEHGVFFFATTEVHKVLPTILSRCQQFDLKRITPQKIQEKLKIVMHNLEVHVTDDALELIAEYAEGSLRDAESFLDQLICYEESPITKEHVTKLLGLLPSKLFFDLDQAVRNNHLPFAFELTDKIFKMGYHFEYFIENLTKHYRNIALIHMGKKLNSEYENSAQIYDREQCLEILDYLFNIQEKIQCSPFKRIHLEIIFIHILRSKKKISIESLVERLEKLKEPTPPQDVNLLEKNSEPTVTSTEKQSVIKAKEFEKPPIDPAEDLEQLKEITPTQDVNLLEKNSEPTVTSTEKQSVIKAKEFEKALIGSVEKLEQLKELTPTQDVNLLEKNSEPTVTSTEKQSAIKAKEFEKALIGSVEKQELALSSKNQKLTDIKKKIKHERLIRFASVELNGSIR